MQKKSLLSSPNFKSLNLKLVITDWKQSRVTPVYKGKGDIYSETNYRPISVIGHIIKGLEKEIATQTMKFLKQYNLITIDQSAFLEFHNTQTALHKVIDDWLENMSDGLFTGVCSLDIMKCFDTINHNILIKKLGYYGVQGIDWFSS